MRKVLVLDVDDTILYWSPNFIKWLFQEKLHEINTHEPMSWYTKSYIDEYNSNGIGSDFSDRGRINEICDLLNDIIPNSGVDVVFISACGVKNYIHQSKALNNCRFDFPYVLRTVDSSNEKIDILLILKTNYDRVLFVDDKLLTIDDALQNGIESILPHLHQYKYKIKQFVKEDDHMGV